MLERMDESGKNEKAEEVTRPAVFSRERQDMGTVSDSLLPFAADGTPLDNTVQTVDINKQQR